MKRFRINSRGDTIVEVLIVVAVLGFAFSISAATANRSLMKSRNAEEHSQALGVMNAQVELLRSAISKGSDTQLPEQFCMNGATAKEFAAVDAYPTECRASTNGLYKQSIVYEGDGNYRIRVQWDGAGSMGPQQESIAYRSHELAPSAVSGVPLTDSAARLTATVEAISPNAGSWINVDPSPSCASSNARTGVSGAQVTLNQVSPTGSPLSKVTDAAGGATFSPLSDYYTFNTSLDTIPTDFVRCQPAVSSNETTVPGPGSNIAKRYTIIPQCTAIPNQRDYLGTYGDYLGNYGDYLGNYSDHLGYYSDPIYFWSAPTPVNFSNASPPSAGETSGIYGVSGIPNPGPPGGQYVYQVSAIYTTYSTWMRRQVLIGWTAPYDHWSAPYDHYTAPYAHYTAPYAHYGPVYTRYTCPNPNI